MTGKPVFGSYSQAALDAQYEQGTLVPDREPYYRRWREGADRARGRLSPREAVPYGAAPEETLDVFPAAGEARGIHVHYHGGAWKGLTSRDAWLIAEPWVAAGHVFVSVNFGLVPAVSLARQVEQARHALAWCHDHAAALGAPDGRLTLSGHSSGAHLAAMAALAEWPGSGPACPPVDAAIIASGSYDLEPVRLSARNGYLRLTEGEAGRLSPIRHLLAHTPPTVVMWSANELAEFQRQGAALADALDGRGPLCRQIVTEGTHFDTWERVTPALLDLLAPGR